MSNRKDKGSNPNEALLKDLFDIAYNSEKKDFKASDESARQSAERSVKAFKRGWVAAAKAKM
jgi:hypothetical protein